MPPRPSHLALFAAVLVACGDGSTNPILPPDVGRAGDGKLDVTLQHIRNATNLPSLAAVLVSGGQVIEAGAVGLRVTGFPERVTTGDRWHLGSLTKSMTAVLAAVLVERGTISWSTTVSDVFPDFDVHPQYDAATLDELLYHTTGLPVDVGLAPSWASLRTDPTPLLEQRRRVAGELVALAPQGPRGTHLYTNAGYIVAGAMLEAVTGELWEVLIAREVFEPLGMTSTAFGAPGAAGSRSQPWGHARRGAGWLAIEPGPGADNPQVMGPAGTVHSTLSDYARYMLFHLAGARGEGGLLSAASFVKLHTRAPGTSYALGWGVVDQDWARGPVLQHGGSNTLWWALVGIAPARDLAMLAVTNAGGEDALRGSDAVIQALLDRFEAAAGGPSSFASFEFAVVAVDLPTP